MSYSRLWWDDYLALGAAVLDFIGFIILGWVMPSRFSPPATHSRMIQYGVGLIRLLERTGTIACSKRSSWLFHAGIVVQCDFSTRFIIYFTTANVVGDILLVCSPIYKLRRVKLPQIQRRLIFTCIAGSTLMSLSCFATSAFQIGPASWEPGRGFIKILLGYLESGISLTICNLLVVVTFLYTVTHKQSNVPPQVSVEEVKTSSVIPTTTRPSSQPAVVSHNTSMGSVFTPLTLTEISEAYLTRTDTASEGS
ncbi:hypothetical protein BJ912DRAFT_920716 [Pholiota molesta]|nr:hypothetical protein BJ912DRAFT_920716 [Pholiota molesta]